MASQEKLFAKALKQGFDVDNAIYIVADIDLDGGFNSPLVILYKDRVEKVQKRIGVNLCEAISIEKVTSVETNKKNGLIQLSIQANSSSISARGAKEMINFANELRKLMFESKNIPDENTVIVNIEKLVQLFEKGYLSKAEFEDQKKKILNLEK